MQIYNQLRHNIKFLLAEIFICDRSQIKIENVLGIEMHNKIRKVILKGWQLKAATPKSRQLMPKIRLTALKSIDSDRCFCIIKLVYFLLKSNNVVNNTMNKNDKK
jgi:hypothetical protein